MRIWRLFGNERVANNKRSNTSVLLQSRYQGCATYALIWHRPKTITCSSESSRGGGIGQGPLSEDGARGLWGIGRASGGPPRTAARDAETAETPETPKARAGLYTRHGTRRNSEWSRQTEGSSKSASGKLRDGSPLGICTPFQRLMRYGVNGGE